MKTTCTIYGTPEQSKTVTVDFEFYPVRKWFGDRSTVFVNYCLVLDSIPFKPNDLEGDIGMVIAERLGERPEDIRFECEVQVPNIITEVPITKMMFV